MPRGFSKPSSATRRPPPRSRATLAIDARNRIGDAERKLGNDKQAKLAYAKAASEFDRRDLKVDSFPIAAEAAAQSRFQLAEYEFAAFDRLKIGGRGKKLERSFASKRAAVKKVNDAYAAVFKYKRLEWTLAALYRRGYALERFGATIIETPVPPDVKRLGTDAVVAYQDLLGQQTVALEDKAVESYAATLVEARKNHLSNEWTKKTLESLNRFRPQEYPVASTSPKQAVAPQQVTPAAAAAASTGGPGGDQDTRATFEKGLSEVRQGDLGAAERSFKSVLERDPKLAPAWANLGVVYERRLLPDQAEQAYVKATEVSPSSGTAWEYLSRLYCRTGRAARMEQRLTSQLQKYPEAWELRMSLGFVLLEQGKFEPAAVEVKKVLQAEERNLRAMQLLGQIYLAERKYELALMVLENAKALDPNDSALYNALGLVHLALKARPAALDAFKKAVSLRPDFAEARNNLGALLNETQDYDAASHELQEAVLAAPDFAAARLNLGNAYRGKRQFDRATSEYKQVLRLKPSLPDTYYNLAILHLDSEIPKMDAIERFKTAIAYFDQYREKGGKDPRVDQYVKDASKGIEKEQRRREREKREQLKKEKASASDKLKK